MTMRLSEAGLLFIAKEEKFEAKPYVCKGGKPTIGFGHVIWPGEKFTKPLSKPEAMQLLRKDVRTYEAAVNSYIEAPLTQCQFDALVSFTFNLGSGALLNSTLRQYLNAKPPDYESAANEFPKWNKVRQGPDRILVEWDVLTRRRAKERDMFLGPPPDLAA